MENKKMINYQYEKEAFSTFKNGIRREWALTNGIGGYAGSSLIGAHNRTHQGYLIASLHPPIERYLVFSKINESLSVFAAENTGRSDEKFHSLTDTLKKGAAPAVSTVYNLETSQHRKNGGTCYTQGQEYLVSFSYDGSVHYTYQAGDIMLKKHICLKHGANVCAIAYEIENNGPDASLTLVPLFNFREHSASSRPEDFHFRTSLIDNSLCLIPESHPDTAILFQTSEGIFSDHTPMFDIDMQLQTEVDLETDGLDCHYCPHEVTVFLPAKSHKQISVLCSVIAADETFTDITADTAFDILKEREKYTKSLYETAGIHDDFADRLVLAADQFLCDRASTGYKTVLAGLPWFTDWGRDTMIAFTGLTLCTGRRKDAEEILLTFSKYIRHGIVPNMFPDDNAAPLYNTADASLWYFYAVWQYLQYYPDTAANAFVQENIYPHLKEIISAYKNGTDFSIYMEEDGLIHAGSGLDQITWMDVRVGDWVATPRHGKPVEINALWYNALKVMEELARRYEGDDVLVTGGSATSSSSEVSVTGVSATGLGSHVSVTGVSATGLGSHVMTSHNYAALAELVKASFCRKFWWEEKGCLYDVVDGDEPDDHLRPNQIYAVSLPFTMLSKEQEAKIVAFVKKYLYIGCGLRSLTSDHADYHGIYCGSLPKRDAAYHQGTAWGFLLGGFLSAYAKVHDHSLECTKELLSLLGPVRHHLTDNGCIGSISEIFDGDAPHNPRGCYAQAWSVGETLRAYMQDVLPYM